MLEVILTVRLALIGPVLTHATAIGAVGIDSPMARDSAERYYLPFSLVRGRLRQSWEELQEATAGVFAPSVDDLLGLRSDQANPPGTGYEPQRARLHFTDFLYDGDSSASGVLYRIRIDPARGTVAQGAMQVIESPFAPGQSVTFTGKISYLASNDAEANAIQSRIMTGLRWTTNLGGERTTGFGRLAAVAILAQECKPVQVASVAGSTTTERASLDLEIRLLAPFCVAKRQVNPNLFESDIVLSGGVLRGALATTLKALAGLPHNAVIDQQMPSPWQELGTHFNRIRFTHAFPAREHVPYRPVVAPLSLVKDTDDKLYDVALCEGPELLGNPPRAPSFAVDWKKSEDVQARFGWSEPERELRVRTAMDRQHRRAKDENLFAYEMVVPTGYRWYGRVDLRQIPAGATREAVEKQLRSILHNGLRGIGKTKAAAEVRIVDTHRSPVHASNPQPIGDLWVVTLQTPALLCDPKQLDEASGEHELFAAYASVWEDLSAGTLQLVRFFANQSLQGGYLVHRFQRGKPYNPFLLTERGSVFVVQASQDTTPATAVIASWLHDGLPLPRWAIDRYGDDWATCPFLPADGFGEIAVNLPCHTQNKPPQPKEVSHAV